MPVRAWEERSDGSPAAKRGLKKRYGFSRDIPLPARQVFRRGEQCEPCLYPTVSDAMASWSNDKRILQRYLLQAIN